MISPRSTTNYVKYSICISNLYHQEIVLIVGFTTVSNVSHRRTQCKGHNDSIFSLLYSAVRNRAITTGNTTQHITSPSLRTHFTLYIKPNSHSVVVIVGYNF